MTAFAQSKSVDSGSVTSANLAFGSNVQPGSLIVVVVRVSANGRTITVTDDHSDSFSAAVAAFSDLSGDDVAVYFAQNVAGGATAITVAISGAATTIRWAIHEWTAAGNSVSVDQEAHTTAGTTSTPSAGPVTTTQADELVFTYIDQGGSGASTATPSAGNKREQVVAAGSLKLATAEQIVSATGAFSSGWTLDGSAWVGEAPGIVTFKVAAPATSIAVSTAPHHPSTLFRPWARHPAFGQDTQVNLAAPVSQSVAPQHPASLFRPWKNKPLPYQPIPPAQPAETVASNVTARSPSTLFRPWARRPLTPDVVPAGGAVRVIAADAIVATSAVTASLAALRPLTPAAINATSPVTASVAALKQFQAAVAATSAVTAAATRIASLQAAAVNATSSVGAAISGIAQNLVDNYRMKKRRRF